MILICAELHSVLNYTSCLFTDKPLGAECVDEDECSDPNSGCLVNENSKNCTCKDDFYDDNGFSFKGDCQSSKHFLVI